MVGKTKRRMKEILKRWQKEKRQQGWRGQCNIWIGAKEQENGTSGMRRKVGETGEKFATKERERMWNLKKGTNRRRRKNGGRRKMQ